MVGSFKRVPIRQFELANKAYIGATITFYQVDQTTYAQLSTLATLYEDIVGSETLSNPHTLDGTGKFAAAVYVEEPVIGVISGAAVDDHETGIIIPDSGTYRGVWTTGTVYYEDDIIKDGANGGNTGNLYIVRGYHNSSLWATDLVAYYDLYLDIESITDEAIAAASSAVVGVVRVTNSDLSSGNLDTKITAGDGITKTVLNPGANEELEISGIALSSVAAQNLGAAAGAGSASNSARADHVHLAPTVTAGTGLTGGGQLTTDRTLDIDVGTGADKIPQINSSGILTGQTIQEYILLLAVKGNAEDETITVVDGSPIGFTIKEIKAITDSGSIVVDTKINGTTIGTTVTATSSGANQAHSDAVAAGAKVEVQLTSNSSAVDLFVYAKIERTL